MCIIEIGELHFCLVSIAEVNVCHHVFNEMLLNLKRV